jgi:hypothetical protein
VSNRVSADALNTPEARFRECIEILGGTCAYDSWQGVKKPHKVICGQGHECNPRPNNVLNGQGFCSKCVGRDSATAQLNFRNRIAELGGTCLYESWQGSNEPHHVTCSAGHDCYPRPRSVNKGRGICRICGNKASARRRSEAAGGEQKFRQRIAELGGTCLYEEWEGTQKPHHVRCANGHDCNPRPNGIQQGEGICRVCARRDPATAEQNFRNRIAELGGTCLYESWQGSNMPHYVRCSAGHDCYPRPGGVRNGQGICRICAGKDSATAEQKFRDRVAELGGTCLYETWRGILVKHHVRCKYGHDCHPKPNSVQQGNGICRACARKDPLTAEQNFRNRIVELGGICLFTEWKGAQPAYHVRCANGHDCYTRPNNVKQGWGICRICAGVDTDTAERNFRKRVAELGGTCLYESWRGNKEPHHVLCKSEHDCYPRPNSIQKGNGICYICAGYDHDVFYIVRNPVTDAVKFGITSGDSRSRLSSHRRDGYSEVDRTIENFLRGDARALETNVKRALRDAGIKPVRGREYFPSEAYPVIVDVVDGWFPSTNTRLRSRAWWDSSMNQESRVG